MDNVEYPVLHLLELHVQVHVVILPRLLRQVVGPPVLAKDRSITSIYKATFIILLAVYRRICQYNCGVFLFIKIKDVVIIIVNAVMM